MTHMWNKQNLLDSMRRRDILNCVYDKIASLEGTFKICVFRKLGIDELIDAPKSKRFFINSGIQSRRMISLQTMNVQRLKKLQKKRSFQIFFR